MRMAVMRSGLHNVLPAKDIILLKYYNYSYICRGTTTFLDYHYLNFIGILHLLPPIISIPALQLLSSSHAELPTIKTLGSVSRDIFSISVEVHTVIDIMSTTSPFEMSTDSSIEQ
ncbi:unnamed protein product [Amoebophrya sp. A25]|nr:unnamed protein product [Amoebophrya sp. A25]|eukprot:GSA25T00018334001.1